MILPSSDVLSRHMVEISSGSTSVVQYWRNSAGPILQASTYSTLRQFSAQAGEAHAGHAASTAAASTNPVAKPIPLPTMSFNLCHASIRTAIRTTIDFVIRRREVLMASVDKAVSSTAVKIPARSYAGAAIMMGCWAWNFSPSRDEDHLIRLESGLRAGSESRWFWVGKLVSTPSGAVRLKSLLESSP